MSAMYSTFVKTTNMTDAVYETIFDNIEKTLQKLSLVRWKQIVYITGSDKNVFSLQEDKVPSYVIELIYNVFENFYTLPDNTCVELHLSYDSIDYTLRSQGLSTDIPVEVQFLKKSQLYTLFFLRFGVVDIFSAYEQNFKFIEDFANKTKTINEYMYKRLSSVESNYEESELEFSESSVSTTMFNLEEAQEKIKEILNNLEIIQAQQEEASQNKFDILKSVNKLDAYRFEINKFSIELQTLQESQELYQNKLDTINDVLHAINMNIDNIVDHGADSSDLELLKQKKTIFLGSQKTAQLSVDNISNIIRDTKNKLKELTNIVSEYESYTPEDINIIDAKINALQQNYEDNYSILIGLEAEVKNQRSKLDNASKVIANKKDATFSNLTVKEVETGELTRHLAQSKLSTPMLTVYNYIKYYYAYYVTHITKKLQASSQITDTYLAQAVASKVVLFQNFGVTMNQLFSIISFTDSKLDNVITIVKE